LGVSANAITYASIAFAALSCIAAVLGAFALASLALVVSGICDALDGVVARSTGTVSRYGALLDSTVDRVTDALPLLGVILFFGHEPALALIPGLALVGSFVIPYARARAEALGIALPGLFMRRPERVVLLVVFLALGELSLATAISAPLLLLGLLVLGVLNLWGAVTVLRAARTALAELEESQRAASSNPTATGRA
jgi:CDP-diacylglycerol--glycerol-3-phosphate 3-phosphatidyltransferase